MCFFGVYSLLLKTVTVLNVGVEGGGETNLWSVDRLVCQYLTVKLCKTT